MGPVDDHREHFSDTPEAATLYAPNILPDTPPGTDGALVELYRAYERLGRDVMRILAAALDQPEDYFAPMMDRHFAVLGAHHYPALAAPPEPGQLRAGAHTDFGAVTILAMTDGRGGLEARTPDGRWLPVQAPKGSLVVNLGDMMARWTNDRWVSTLHRVATPEVGDDGSRRLSMAFSSTRTSTPRSGAYRPVWRRARRRNTRPLRQASTFAGKSSGASPPDRLDRPGSVRFIQWRRSSSAS